jgi:hypothetical protein
MGIACVAFHELAAVATRPLGIVRAGPRVLVCRHFLGPNGRYLARLANWPRPHGFVIQVMKDYGRLHCGPNGVAQVLWWCQIMSRSCHLHVLVAN